MGIQNYIFPYIIQNKRHMLSFAHHFVTNEPKSEQMEICQIHLQKDKVPQGSVMITTLFIKQDITSTTIRSISSHR